jgi:DNA-binding NarL/FixJ family response regulator
MTLKQACHLLTLACKKAARAKEDIAQLNKIIKGLGGHPDEKKRRRRNREIIRLYHEGQSYSAIAREFRITPSGVRLICRRIESQVQKAQ